MRGFDGQARQVTGPDQDELGALMQRAQQGDRDAYAALLHAMLPLVRQAIRRHRGFAGAEAVEDLVQDVLLSVHKARATYDAARPFRPWLSAIVRHRLADGARRYARREAREVALTNEADVTSADGSTNPLVDAPGDVDALRAAVRALPPGQRRAIELLKLRELSLEEASRETGSTVGALKVATHRGLAALRRALVKPGTDGD